MLSEALKERWRLTATWMNTIAAGSIVTGLAVPAVAWGYQAPGYHFEDRGLWVSGSLVLFGIVLHMSARLLLRLVIR